MADSVWMHSKYLLTHELATDQSEKVKKSGSSQVISDQEISDTTTIPDSAVVNVSKGSGTLLVMLSIYNNKIVYYFIIKNTVILLVQSRAIN